MIEKFNVKPETANEIEKLLLYDNDFPWFYHGSTLNNKEEEIKKDTSIDSPQFTHVFYFDGKPNSDYYNNILKVLYDIKFPYEKINLHRVKGNLNFNIKNYTKENHQPIHFDTDKTGSKSFIYYVNDSDGDTLFFDDELNVIDRISPKKGMGILFDSNIKHAAQNPMTNYARCIINYVWWI